jgi:hypothetical protein
MNAVAKRILQLGNTTECGNFIVHVSKSGCIGVYERETGEELGTFPIYSKGSELFYQNNINNKCAISLAEVRNNEIVAQHMIFSTYRKEDGRILWKADERWVSGRFKKLVGWDGAYVCLPTESEYKQTFVHVSELTNSKGRMTVVTGEVNNGLVNHDKSKCQIDMHKDTRIAWVVEGDRLYLVGKADRIGLRDPEHSESQGYQAHVAYKVAQKKYGVWEVRKAPIVVGNPETLKEIIDRAEMYTNELIYWYTKLEFDR